MCKLRLSILKYIGVHGFVDLPNRKCDLGRFPLDSSLGPSGRKYISTLLIPHSPCKFCPPPKPEISSDPSWDGGGGGMAIFWNHTLRVKIAEHIEGVGWLRQTASSLPFFPFEFVEPRKDIANAGARKPRQGKTRSRTPARGNPGKEKKEKPEK